MLQDHDGSLLSLSSSNPSFSKAGASFPGSMSAQSGGAPLTLDGLAGTYNPASHIGWPQGNAGYPTACLKQEPISIPIEEHTLSSQTSAAALLPHPPVFRTEKTVDLHPVKQEKGAGGSGVGKPPPQSSYPPPAPPQPSPAQKLSLDKYREKHSGALIESDVRGDLSSSASTYALSSTSLVDHRKHSLPHPMSQHALSGGASTTASPMKSRVPSSTSGQDRRHHSDKRDKGSLKLRPVVPGSCSNPQLDKSVPQSKDELKMKIKVSSLERHSSSDEGMAANNKSKHSSPMVSKEKQLRGVDHNLHRHHKHSHSNPNTHSGNGREGLGGVGGLLRGPPGLVSMEGTALAHPGSTSLSSQAQRKRAYPEASHNHHPSSSSSTSFSKLSKNSKGGTGAAGTSSFSSPFFPSCASPVLQFV